MVAQNQDSLNFDGNPLRISNWLPRNPCVQIKLDITKTSTLTDNIKFTISPRDAIFSLVQHQMNGTLVGSSNEPDVDGIVMKRAFMKKEVRDTSGDLQGLNESDSAYSLATTVTSLGVMYTPPLGLWATDSIGGASHVLSLTTHANLIERIVQTAAWKEAGNLTIAIESVRLMVAHATPEVAVPVQRTTVINTV